MSPLGGAMSEKTRMYLGLSVPHHGGNSDGKHMRKLQEFDQIAPTIRVCTYLIL